MPIPLRGDRAVRETLHHPDLHADDVEDDTPTIHNPLGTVVGQVTFWDGVKWVARLLLASDLPVLTNAQTIAPLERAICFDDQVVCCDDEIVFWEV